ncbi:MAG: EamA family transporter RarD [Clostridiales bacterium]|nr:EamA family transporter RarD [Clostridiales bacterium]
MESKSLAVNDRRNDYRIGVICVLACQVFWGFCPIYWQALEPIPAWIIILYRIVTMFIYSYAAARFQYSREEIWGPLRDRRVRIRNFTAGLILTANWSIYIWAMTSERVIQASIGYYIEPLVICAVGIIVFKEKLTKYNLTAILFACLAIALIIVHYRQLPGVALGLAGTWAVYSAVKKTSEQPVLIALVHETVLYSVIALAAIIFIESKGIGAVSLHVPGKYALMFLSGLITLIPVALFSVSAKKVSLLVIGLAQYVSPTISLILGIFMFKEPVDKAQIIAFIIIWTGLAIFTIGEFIGSKKQEQE